jgi:hypothetical protein
MISMIMTQSTLLHTGLDEFWTILTISRLSPYAFTWDTWNWTNSNTANPRNSCVTNGTERICVFVRYCANIVLNIIKCINLVTRLFPLAEKTLVWAGHVTIRISRSFWASGLLAYTLTRPKGIVGQKTYCKNGGKTAGEFRFSQFVPFV